MSNFQLPSLGMKHILLIIFGLFALFAGCSVASTFNKEAEIRTTYEAEFKVRSALFDKVWRTIKQTNELDKRNAANFQNMVASVMEGRKDGEGLMFKFVQEQNPGMNFQEVSRLTEKVMNVIIGERENFFQQEKKLADIAAQQNKLLRKFPGGLILRTFFDVKEIDFKPITSTRTQKAVETGIDDDVSL